MRFRRPFAALSTLGLSAHNAFETRAGRRAGLRAGAGPARRVRALGGADPAGLLAAARGGGWDERLSAFNAGIGAAGVAVHFKAWPWSLHGGLPMLDEAEGLTEDQLPAYNAVLWAWGVASALSLATETPSRARARFALAGLLNFPILLASARPPLPLGARAGEARPGALEPGAAARTDAVTHAGPAAPAARSASASTTSASTRRRAPRAALPGAAGDARRTRPDRDLLRRGRQRRARAGGAARDHRRGPRGRLPRLAARAVGRAERRRAGREPGAWRRRLRDLGIELQRPAPARRPARRGRRRGSARGRPALRLAGGRGRRHRGRHRPPPLPVAPRRRHLDAPQPRPRPRTDDRLPGPDRPRHVHRPT